MAELNIHVTFINQGPGRILVYEKNKVDSEPREFSNREWQK